jgi:alpha-glucosidase
MLWNWDVDRTLYPDWEALLTEFRSQGVRVLTYFNPFLADPEGWPGTRRNLYAEAKAQGFLVQRSNGSVYPVGNGGFQAGLMDLTSPGARTLLKDIMKRQLSLGVSGWMADFGEALPYDARLASGVPASTFHNQYPLQWAKLNREALQEAGLEDDAIFFSRSGNARSPAYSKAFWIGDQNTTWDDKDGIKTVIPALLSGGMSGYSLNHMDVGGWLSLTIPLVHFTRSKELMQRWLELGAFGALYRLHHTNRPSQNWQWDSDQETLELFARMSRLYAALGPYRMELMNDARDKGWPLLRHLWLHFPDDPEVLGLERQMMFGSELLVAPALESRKATVRVYLPAGDWVLSWDGASYGSPMAGRWVTVPAPLGQPPIFYRRGSLQGEALVTRLRNEGLLR